MKVNKQIFDKGKGEDKIVVIRFQGSKKIREMAQDGKYIEAFVHTQLGIEKILWDKIVGLFEGEKAMKVRRTIDESPNTASTRTRELIKWAYFLGAISKNEYKDLNDFIDKRNEIIHRAGKEWEIKEWGFKEYTEALEKGIKFLEKNNF